MNNELLHPADIHTSDRLSHAKDVKRRILTQKIWLCIPPVTWSIADAVATLTGQPPTFWSGAYRLAREWNPIAQWFMHMHPLAFLAADLALIALVSSAIILLPVKLAKTLSVFIVMAHTNAVAAWLIYSFHTNWWTYTLTWLVSAILLVYTLARSDASGVAKP